MLEKMAFNYDGDKLLQKIRNSQFLPLMVFASNIHHNYSNYIVLFTKIVFRRFCSSIQNVQLFIYKVKWND